MLNIDETITDGNIEMLSQFQQLLKLDGTVGQSVVGDQLTCKYISERQREEQLEKSVKQPHCRGANRTQVTFLLCGSVSEFYVNCTGELKTSQDHWHIFVPQLAERT